MRTATPDAAVVIRDRSLAVTWRRLPPPGAFSGMTSFSLHGLDVDPCDPVEATSPIECKLVGVNLRRAKLPEEDVVLRRGMRTTTVPRTLADLCIRLNITEAVAMADMALHAGLTNLAELAAWVGSHPGRQGIKRLRRVVAFAEPAAESPMESRLRMLLVLNRLPRPKAQVCIHDVAGRFVGRVEVRAAIGTKREAERAVNAAIGTKRARNQMKTIAS